LRDASVWRRPRGISHNRLRTVLSAMPLRGGFRALSAQGRRKSRQVRQDFGQDCEHERLLRADR
jgi:hypothetical protein